MSSYTLTTSAFEDRVLAYWLAQRNADRASQGLRAIPDIQTFLEVEFRARLAPSVADFRAQERVIAAAKFDAMPEGAEKDELRAALGIS